MPTRTTNIGVKVKTCDECLGPILIDQDYYLYGPHQQCLNCYHIMLETEKEREQCNSSQNKS